ncbi:hypothetical protein ASE67_08065 [Sphingomonas sp. Leaf23]|uniref:hypothetical protein n=1 Tax=Sphingomonas sp. Leaf23 TaxID=1735689 RepID=UPI0006F50A9A|nr:hypothetical protein [Sphingomonas sp. Leaf23]KQM87631.1 hypothetical protein ASE67_08065 [Sphingomonas sp. Leaf23]
MLHRMRAIILTLAAGAGVSACAYGDYGYSGVSVGYASPGYYGGGYGGYGGYYDDYAGGFGDPYWGWFGDYYYPGSGYYVYDRYRRPFRWNDRQRSYWEQRRGQWRGGRGDGRPRWDGWDRPGWNDRRPGFDGRPGFENVPRGSTQSPLPGRPDGWRGNRRPGFDDRRGFENVPRGDWRGRPDGAPDRRPGFDGRPGFRNVPRGDNTSVRAPRPDAPSAGAARGFGRPEGIRPGGGRFRGPAGRGPDRRGPRAE